MKKLQAHLLIVLLFFLAAACSNDPDPETVISGELRVVGMVQNANSTTIYNYGMQSNSVSSFDIECSVLGSTIYDRVSNSFGYVDCNNTFKLVNPLNGMELISFEVSHNLSELVIDEANYQLIGYYHDQNTATKHLAIYDLNSGQLLADNVIDGIEAFYTCSRFFHNGVYYLMTSENKLVGLNPMLGTEHSRIQFAAGGNVSYFNSSEDQLIIIEHVGSTQSSFINTIDFNTGQSTQRIPLNDQNYYYACVNDYDLETNSFVRVRSDGTIVFIDANTGEISETSQLDGEVQALAFYRAQ